MKLFKILHKIFLSFIRAFLCAEREHFFFAFLCTERAFFIKKNTKKKNMLKNVIKKAPKIKNALHLFFKKFQFFAMFLLFFDLFI
jgi:hypothetical protein